MNISEFYNLQKSDEKYVIVMGAEWCAPCKTLEKNIEQILIDHVHLKDKIIKLDVDKEVLLTEDLHIKSVPTVFFIGNGSGERKTGVVSSSKLMEFLDG